MKWDPRDYAQHSAAQLGWARELIARLELTGRESILDVGCGDGKVTAEFARAVPDGHVLGVDSSAEFIAFASEHHPPGSHRNLAFMHMDARRLAVDRMFDLVFSNAALHWVDDHRAFLRGVRSILAPRGRLIISCGGRGNAAEVVQVMEHLATLRPWRDCFAGFTFPYYFYGPREYLGWLAEAGLRAIRCELVEKEMRHDGPAGLAAWIRTTWMPYTHCVPEDRRCDFINAFVEEYLARRPLDAAGCACVRMVRLEVEAR